MQLSILDAGARASWAITTTFASIHTLHSFALSFEHFLQLWELLFDLIYKTNKHISCLCRQNFGSYAVCQVFPPTPQCSCEYWRSALSCPWPAASFTALNSWMNCLSSPSHALILTSFCLSVWMIKASLIFQRCRRRTLTTVWFLCVFSRTEIWKTKSQQWKGCCLWKSFDQCPLTYNLSSYFQICVKTPDKNAF